jgi:hypothetical protein
MDRVEDILHPRTSLRSKDPAVVSRHCLSTPRSFLCYDDTDELLEEGYSMDYQI